MNTTGTTAIPESLQTVTTFPIKMDAIPQKLQLPLVVVLGLIGFLVVIGMSRVSAQKDEGKAVQFDAPSSTPVKGTPQKSGTPIATKTGSVMTPGGRRSARIAKTRRKED